MFIRSSLIKNIIFVILLYLFLVRKNIRITDVILQDSEVSEVRFLDKKEFIDMLNKNNMVDAMKHCHILLDYLN